MTRKSVHIANLYDHTAGIYNKRYKKIQEAKINLLIKYRTNIKSKLVLDAGCGSGLLIPFLGKETKYVGVDISHEMLKQNTPKIEIVRSDISNLPFFDKVFDEVYCITVLQNIDNKIQTLSELKRVLKNRGRIFLSILRKAYNKDDLSPLYDLRLINTINDDSIEDIMFIFEKIA